MPMQPFGELYIGHKINVVCGGLFILSSIIHMIVVPSDMMHTDSGVDDACTNVTTSVPAPGSYLLGECAAGPGPAGCGPNCPEEYAAAKEDNLECGDDVSADDCVASVQTHQHVASCPAGCLFTPRFTFEEESRFGALIVRVLWALVGLLGAGLMADPAALGPCKVCSVIWIIGSVLSILWHLFYLLYLMYSIPFLCDDHGLGANAEALTDVQSEIYGGEAHFCEQFTGGSGTVCFLAILIALLASLGGAVGGSMASCCMPADKAVDSG